MNENRVMLLLPEEHVHRMKNSMGRTSKGVLNQVASSVEATPWYSKLLDEYIQTSAATLERAPLMQSYLQQLNDLTMATLSSGFDILVDISKAIPDMQLMLRNGSVDELKGLFRLKLDILGSYLEEKGKRVEKVNLDKIHVILTEALIVYPVDGKLNEWSCVASDLLQESGQQEVIHSVLTSLNKLKEAELMEKPDFEVKVNEVLAEISPSNLTLDMLCEEEKVALENMFLVIFGALDKFIDVEKLGAMENNTNTILAKVSAWLNKSHLQCEVLALEEGIAAINAYKALQEVKAEDNPQHTSLLNQSVLLHRRVMRWKSSFEQLHGQQ
eukprot:723405-Amphidinium_carterae.5